jgi:hypothetical protein
VEEANKYNQAREQRDRLRVQQALWRLYHVQARIGAEEEGFEAANEAMAAASASEAQLSSRVAKAAESVAKVRECSSQSVRLFLSCSASFQCILCPHSSPMETTGPEGAHCERQSRSRRLAVALEGCRKS